MKYIFLSLLPPGWNCRRKKITWKYKWCINSIMPHVGGEMFSDLAQKMYWRLHRLSQLRCHEDQSRYCNPATADAVDSKAYLVSKLSCCFSWKVRWKLPQRIKWQSRKRLLILPLVHIPIWYDHLIPMGELLSPAKPWSREVWLCATAPSYMFLEWTCKTKFCLSLKLGSAASKKLFCNS